ncbi:MAG: DNA-binding protein [Thermodesulfobacteriota bacterium]
MFKKFYQPSVVAIFATLALSATPFSAGAFPKDGGASAGMTAAQSGGVKAKVLETMNSGGYTYFHAETADGKIWVAVPEAKISKGQEVTYLPGMVMKNFESKTLGRTFESVVFSSGLAGNGKGGNPHKAAPKASTGGDSFDTALQAETGMAMQAAPSPQAAGSGGSMGAMVPQADIKTDKAAGENSYTVGEIFEKRKDISGKTVRVHGKVVKFSPSIMGRNWIHLQDGTGDALQNTHDLVVTTNDKPGDKKEITIEGKAVADRDFGAGYNYVVIIEDAKIIK